jgi:uncharacterized membrane protein YhaH (DUF805 family)
METTMDFKHLLTGFDGRIGRKQFWIGILCIVVVSLILLFVLAAILPSSLASVVGMLIVLYPAAAIYAKRLQDRNKPITPWLWILLVPGIVYSIMSALGIGFTEMQIPGQPPAMVPSGMIGYAATTVVSLIGLWALIELGFLKGTDGPNEFGADPTN